MNKLLCLVLPMSLIATPAAAAVCEARSGNNTVALLELYTSEGCDSCPPADRWIASLARRGIGPERVIPLALHVDYWNDLGWIDRFSQAQFTRRQHDLAGRNNSRVVYTPQLMLNGRDYRWHSDTIAADAKRINAAPARADVALQLERNAQTLRVTSNAVAKQMPASAGLYLALYESGLRTDVRAGENRGHTLEHAHVVRRLLGPFALDAGGKARVNETLTLDPTWNVSELGVVAFVQELKSTEVLQALALGLCR
jgi:hypothetical protein